MATLLGPRHPRAWSLACCMHPAIPRHRAEPLAEHLVTGELAPPGSDPLEQVLCSIERTREGPDHCGAAGRLWQRR